MISSVQHVRYLAWWWTSELKQIIVKKSQSLVWRDCWHEFSVEKHYCQLKWQSLTTWAQIIIINIIGKWWGTCQFDVICLFCGNWLIRIKCSQDIELIQLNKMHQVVGQRTCSRQQTSSTPDHQLTTAQWDKRKNPALQTGFKPITFCTTLTKLKYIKVHTATRWTIRHSLMLHWFADSLNLQTSVASNYVLQKQRKEVK